MTRLLRYSKLTVADEIENALSYYETTFLREVPKLYASAGGCAGRAEPSTASCAWGSGLAGTAMATPMSRPHTLELALRRQSEVVLRHYLTEVHYLGAELSMSARLVEVSPAMQALAMPRPTPIRTARTSPTAVP